MFKLVTVYNARQPTLRRPAPWRAFVLLAQAGEADEQLARRGDAERHVLEQ